MTRPNLLGGGKQRPKLCKCGLRGMEFSVELWTVQHKLLGAGNGQSDIKDCSICHSGSFSLSKVQLR